MIITSVNNENIKHLVKLKQKKYRDKFKSFLVEGKDLVDIALSKNLVKEIYTTKNDYNFHKVVRISDIVMKKISSLSTPTDVVALVEYIDRTKLENNILLLDHIQDPTNLGVIIRSASAFDFGTIVLDNCVDIYNEKVISASRGEIFNINFLNEKLIDYLPLLQQQKYLILATDVDKGKSIKEFKSNKLALILGNEGSGVRKELKNISDDVVKINTTKVESLNVAVSGSILMYEVFND